MPLEIPTSLARTSSRTQWAFAAAVLITALLYLPGLKGSFFFDDYPNIVDNVHLHVDSLDWRQWWQALWASPSSDLQRPLASLSFALNYFADGLDPWSMKAVNLGLHLLNGCLLYLVILRIAALAKQASVGRSQLLAAVVSAAWLLHPINLTAVLYIVQRMESLAQVFVLAGLLFYVGARTRQQAGEPGSGWRLWGGFPLMLVLGLLTKESAALLPLYALCVEATLPARARTPAQRRTLAAFFGIFLLLPAVVGSAWLLPRILSPGAYAGRSFTLLQRLLTEPRVLLDYVDWILLPVPSAFSFYHDTLAVSTSLVSPWTTWLSIAALTAAAIAGVLLRKSRPLAALGIFWFLAAHVMTATVIPLELVFEHRNYFASAGLLLAAADAILPATTAARFPLARYTFVVAFLVLSGLTLSIRAKEWSHPISLASAEVTRHPDSPRATYEYGRTLTILSNYDKDSPLVPKAFEALSRAAAISGSGILPNVGLIMLASRTGRPVDPAWQQSIRDKLLRQPPSAENDEGLKNLTRCQLEERCNVADNDMLQIYFAAMHDDAATPANLYSYALFAHNRMHDDALALRLATEAADRSPNDPRYRLNLVDFLLSQGQKEAAAVQLAQLKKQDRKSAFAAEIVQAQRRLESLP